MEEIISVLRLTPEERQSLLGLEKKEVDTNLHLFVSPPKCLAMAAAAKNEEAIEKYINRAKPDLASLVCLIQDRRLDIVSRVIGRYYLHSDVRRKIDTALGRIGALDYFQSIHSPNPSPHHFLVGLVKGNHNTLVKSLFDPSYTSSVYAAALRYDNTEIVEFIRDQGFKNLDELRLPQLALIAKGEILVDELLAHPTLEPIDIFMSLMKKQDHSDAWSYYSRKGLCFSPYDLLLCGVRIEDKKDVEMLVWIIKHSSSFQPLFVALAFDYTTVSAETLADYLSLFPDTVEIFGVYYYIFQSSEKFGRYDLVIYFAHSLLKILTPSKVAIFLSYFPVEKDMLLFHNCYLLFYVLAKVNHVFPEECSAYNTGNRIYMKDAFEGIPYAEWYGRLDKRINIT